MDREKGFENGPFEWCHFRCETRWSRRTWRRSGESFLPCVSAGVGSDGTVSLSSKATQGPDDDGVGVNLPSTEGKLPLEGLDTGEVVGKDKVWDSSPTAR